MPREIIQKIEIHQTPENIFGALLNPSAITEWWGAKTAIVVKEDNGIYAVTWGENVDDPEYVTISLIKNFMPSKGFTLEYLTYAAKAGRLPFEAKMNVHFTITPMNASSTGLEVKQTGFPDDQIADDYFEGCKTGWHQVLKGIKQYCGNK